MQWHVCQLYCESGYCRRIAAHTRRSNMSIFERRSGQQQNCVGNEASAGVREKHELCLGNKKLLQVCNRMK